MKPEWGELPAKLYFTWAEYAVRRCICLIGEKGPTGQEEFISHGRLSESFTHAALCPE